MNTYQLRNLCSLFLPLLESSTGGPTEIFTTSTLFTMFATTLVLIGYISRSLTLMIYFGMVTTLPAATTGPFLLGNLPFLAATTSSDHYIIELM